MNLERKLPHEDPDRDEKRYLLAQRALHQYRYLPWRKLKYRNLRKDFYDKGLIPQAYFSYCLSSKQPFREAGSIKTILDTMCDCGDVVQVCPRVMAEDTGLEIDPKTTLYVCGDMADERYERNLRTSVERNISYRPPFRHQPQFLYRDLQEGAETRRKPRQAHDQWCPEVVGPEAHRGAA